MEVIIGQGDFIDSIRADKYESIDFSVRDLEHHGLIYCFII